MQHLIQFMTPPHLKGSDHNSDATSQQSINWFVGLAFCQVPGDRSSGRVAAEEEGGLLAPSLPRSSARSWGETRRRHDVGRRRCCCRQQEDDHHSDPFLTKPFKIYFIFCREEDQEHHKVSILKHSEPCKYIFCNPGPPPQWETFGLHVETAQLYILATY